MDGTPEKKPMGTALSPTKLVLIHLFMVMYWGIAIIHISPPGPLYFQLVSKVNPICSALHIDQHWNMFSAPLRDYNETAQAFVTFSDGSVKLHEFLRLDLLDPFQQWRRGKLREVLFDTMLNPQLWHEIYPSVARYVVRANENPENQPAQVSIGGNWNRIPSFDEPCTIDALPQNRYHTTMLIYGVSKDDLR
jgi:hypothetical protein